MQYSTIQYWQSLMLELNVSERKMSRKAEQSLQSFPHFISFLFSHLEDFISKLFVQSTEKLRKASFK